VVKHVPEEIDGEGCGNSMCSCTSDDCESDGSFTSVVEVKTAYMPNNPLNPRTGVHNKDLSQVLAQTIVNAFIQNRKFPDLKEHFIPCFLASENYITIHMYNPL
jgi:hypothetical protein